MLPTVLRDWWGFFIRLDVNKVGIFLDYENIHRTGHQLFSHANRQASEWLKDPRVRLVRRDLKYEIDRELGKFQAREKGIDVALAITLVESSILGKSDSVVVFSSDTDLLPAIELVYKQTKCHLEIACWKGARPLWFPELLQKVPRIYSPYCHFLDADDFNSCRNKPSH